MCGLFVCSRVREARKRGWGISNFLGFLGIVGWGGMDLSLSESEKFLNFWEIWVFWVSKGMEM